MWAGSVGRECVAGSVGRECRPAVWIGGTGNLYPFRQFLAVWVEIYNRRLLGVSTFSADFPDLGRDLHPAATGFSTFSAVFHYLGRDLHPAATGISTFFGRFSLFE